MKILQISNKIPFPEKDGGAIAIGVFTNSLIKAGCEVKMLAMNTAKHHIDIPSISEKFRTDTGLETVDVDNSVKPVKALMALLSRKSYNIARFESPQFGRKLAEILQHEKFDIIQLESIYVAPYLEIIRQYSNAPVVLRANNVEWKIWQGLASQEKKPLKKWYLNKLSNALREYELNVLNLCDGIITFTVNDLKILQQQGCRAPIAHIPFGIDVTKYIPAEKEPDDSLFYIGALDWLPNLQGLDWFLKNVWTKVHVKFPGLKFHIAGRNMPRSLARSKYPGVVFHGEVENAISFMQQYGVMLVPLQAGSGIRVKIIEGMALGKPIITTSVGIEGIECSFGKDVMVTDTPEEFAEAISNCLSDKERRKLMALNGRKFVLEYHDISKITENLLQFYEKLKVKK